MESRHLPPSKKKKPIKLLQRCIVSQMVTYAMQNSMVTLTFHKHGISRHHIHIHIHIYIHTLSSNQTHPLLLHCPFPSSIVRTFSFPTCRILITLTTLPMIPPPRSPHHLLPLHNTLPLPLIIMTMLPQQLMTQPPKEQ